MLPFWMVLVEGRCGRVEACRAKLLRPAAASLAVHLRDRASMTSPKHEANGLYLFIDEIDSYLEDSFLELMRAY
jgi:hypothetical protein